MEKIATIKDLYVVKKDVMSSGYNAHKIPAGTLVYFEHTEKFGGIPEELMNDYKAKGARVPGWISYADEKNRIIRYALLKPYQLAKCNSVEDLERYNKVVEDFNAAERERQEESARNYAEQNAKWEQERKDKAAARDKYMKSYKGRMNLLTEKILRALVVAAYIIAMKLGSKHREVVLTISKYDDDFARKAQCDVREDIEKALGRDKHERYGYGCPYAMMHY